MRRKDTCDVHLTSTPPQALVIIATMKYLTGLLLLVAATAGAHAADPMVVSTDWLAKQLKSSRIAIVHIAATPEKFAEGHVPGSLFLPAGKILQKRAGLPNEVPPMPELQASLEALGIGNRKRIVIVSDDPLLAGRLFFTLDLVGHAKRAALLDGGIAAWKRENRPLATGPAPEPKPAPFVLRLNTEKIVFLSEMKALVPPKSVSLVDARPVAEFTGETPGDDVSRPGHIPGAINIPWTANLKEDGTLLDAEALQKLYEGAGVKRGWRVIVYCRTGRQASFGYFVLRLLGYEASLYDGSFVEWSNDPVAPVATP